MAEGTWKCSKCGQLYSYTENSCPICFITRENQTVIGKASAARFAKPLAEKVDVVFPFTIKEARFNLPMDRGAVWSSVGTHRYVRPSRTARATGNSAGRGIALIGNRVILFGGVDSTTIVNRPN